MCMHVRMSCWTQLLTSELLCLTTIAAWRILRPSFFLPLLNTQLRAVGSQKERIRKSVFLP